MLDTQVLQQPCNFIRKTLLSWIWEVTISGNDYFILASSLLYVLPKSPVSDPLILFFNTLDKLVTFALVGVSGISL